LFGIWKNPVKDNEFRNADKVELFVGNFWSEVTLEEVQPVFHEEMRRIKSVSEHDGEHFPEETSWSFWISSTQTERSDNFFWNARTCLALVKSSALEGCILLDKKEGSGRTFRTSP
jgi:hypothetical protein